MFKRVSFLTDETWWLTVATTAAAVLSTCGLGHLATEVKAVIDAGAAVIGTVYVASPSTGRGAPIVTAATPATPGAAASGAPQLSPEQAAAVEVLARTLKG